MQRLAAVSNPSCPSQALTEAVDSRVANLQAAAAANPSLALSALRQAVDPAMPSPNERLEGWGAWQIRALILRAAASNPACPQRILADLATHSRDDKTKEAVASNQAAGSLTLALLSRHRLDTVRCRVAANPVTPRAALLALARDSVEPVRREAAENPSTPEPVLAILACDPAKGTRYAAAEALAARTRRT